MIPIPMGAAMDAASATRGRVGIPAVSQQEGEQEKR
jgi:hypothetical protein